jgi:hypothetical protein
MERNPLRSFRSIGLPLRWMMRLGRYADFAHHPLGKIPKFANFVRILELRQAEAR